MNDSKKNKAGELEWLLGWAEDIEIFRERMLEFLQDLDRRPSLPDGDRLRVVQRNACSVLVPALVEALRDHGYGDRLDTLSDAQHALGFYEQSVVSDARGQSLADALFAAMTFIDPHWQQTEEYLWRLCYRLAQLAALERDRRKETVKRTISKANKARSEPRWDQQAAIAYVPRNAHKIGGGLKSKAELSRELYRHLWHESRQGDGRVFTLACEGINSDGSGKPTDRALKTIQGWIAAVYAAQK